MSSFARLSADHLKIPLVAKLKERHKTEPTGGTLSETRKECKSLPQALNSPEVWQCTVSD